MIEELSLVALRRDIPAHGLVAGDVGTVVMVHANGAGYTVEFIAFDGETIAIETLPADALRPLAPREIANARAVA